jgi:hypothetical protein
LVWQRPYAGAAVFDEGGPKLDEAATVHNLQPGGKIEVRSRFDRSWARGFEVAEVMSGGVRVRRLSDGAVLPVVFGADDVRRERERGPGW